MKIINIILLFLFLVKSSHSSEVIVVNIEKLIDQNLSYIKIIKKIEKSQSDYLLNFQKEEIRLNNLLEEIENSKLILSEKDLETLVVSYNNQLADFNILVNNFNTHYQNQIINIRQSVFQEIIVLIENYVKSNDVDLVLDSTSYLIASNKINITDIILDELEDIKIKLQFDEF